MGALYLRARTFCILSDTILYQLRALIFTVITEVWPHANRAVVTINSTVITEVVQIKVVLIEGFPSRVSPIHPLLLLVVTLEDSRPELQLGL